MGPDTWLPMPYRDRWVHKIIPVPVSVLTKICMPQLRWVIIVQKVLTKIWSCHFCSDCLDKDVHAAAELSHYCQCSEGLDKDLHTDPSHSCSAVVLTKMCMRIQVTIVLTILTKICMLFQVTIVLTVLTKIYILIQVTVAVVLTKICTSLLF